MKRAFLLVCLVLLPVLASAQFVPYYGPRAPQSVLRLPMTVTTSDGLTLAAGEYRVGVRQELLKKVGRPSASMGFWPGPRVTLERLNATVRNPAPYHLKTSVEVRVLYDLPNEERGRQAFTASHPNEVLPMIRNGVLVALVYRGSVLHITEASRGRPFSGPSIVVRP